MDVNTTQKKLELKKKIRATHDEDEKQRLRQELANLDEIEVTEGKYCTGYFGLKKY